MLYLPALLHYENYTVSIFYRWWTIHLWVEGVWEMIQGGFLAYLLIRLSGADREVMEKWLYVIVGLVFIAGILGTAHHYYWVGVPDYWLPIGGFFSALEPVALVGMAMYAYSAMRRSGAGASEHAGAALDAWAARCSRCSAPACWAWRTPCPSVNKWTHGTLITAMHGHAAFYGAYAMIVLAMITYALPAITRRDSEEGSSIGYWAFWLQLGGMFGMTLSFATAGIGQVYLERIMGLGYLDTQLKIQVHFLMLIATASMFAIGVGLFIFDFFRHAPRFESSMTRGAGRRARRAVAHAVTAWPPRAVRRRDGALPATARALLPAAAATKCAIFEQCHARKLAVHAQGPDRLRQDALRRAHGLAAAAGRWSPSPATTT